ncbi:DNA polymerase III subunit delta' [Niameybacter massiliensis]|uniref:DNA polymerase III subunit delta n=1 Tax=Holtiella tumoricola TaxID=3018743 RepID=A0AA42DPF6_9FIRM|nr:DNA polymerase III subunit delta' [Holtiella tumoricola]MDA3732794.1 DNA polymerase III subunit delta' [Holtiella tumoricola]
MDTFNKIIGHEDIKRYFNKAIKSEKVSHSYIFEGPEGVGKKSIAQAVAKSLLCQGEDKPCGKCRACLLLEAGNHPDLIYVEKDNKTTKIDTVREKLVKNMDVKPYQGPYKIIVVTEADTLTIEGQNAMLKTIEEPPSYGIVILITQNLAKLLPTIKSRCIHLRFSPLPYQDILEYLAPYQLSERQTEIYAQFAEGSIGIAKKLIEDERFLEDRKKGVDLLLKLQKADLMNMYDLVKVICDEKEFISSMLHFWLLWYRDLAVLKATGNENLYYLDYQFHLLDMSSKLTYNTIDKHIKLIKNAQTQINQNIYATFVIENLLLKLKEKKK